jgi:Type III restriction enzyme, res subunit
MEGKHRRPMQGAAVQGQEVASLCTADSAQAQERKLELRPYQDDVINRLRVAALTHRRVLLVPPTGSGKTVMASAIVYDAVAKGRRVLFLTHRLGMRTPRGCIPQSRNRVGPIGSHADKRRSVEARAGRAGTMSGPFPA